ncbi:hypothetical protein L249_4402 [Ophiocordyceps polyrhachis-furcata BCC 54312]|uniref:Atos-like conserved domain-containing protein n=1 Tax=Ophiocordyceps polyrhachis-furcata BCC 54312 TaxID=1330021 RepID=A0A367L844_9HYPO|nr:hypothetical protein L249_4402 [Ophiocordyceps polyrhachis-furcata BCC 54312]
MPIFQSDLDNEPASGSLDPDDAAFDASTWDRSELIDRLKRGQSPAWIPRARHNLDATPGLLPLSPAGTTPAERSGSTVDGSALHTGDFTHHHGHDTASTGNSARSPFRFEHRRQLTDSAATLPSGPSPLSSSFASLFAYHPPTSPLVQSESNDEPMSPAFASPASVWPQPQSRRGSLPYQAHQPRRCVTSTPGVPWSSPSSSSPQTRARRPSLGSDPSPIQHASMVGSYEESILRGRMSTTPSKPFDFLAQIGVLGKGKCKPSLVCPSHVLLHFPAVYYNYGGRPGDDPSPYVGQIDLENGLPDDSRSRRKLKSRYPDTAPEPAAVNRRSNKRRSISPKAPPGGSYRIPEKGQVQIVIKNQNKSAIKLFLVPYDLAGMEPGTKTFIRQRSYSSGPIIANNGPEKESRPMLRYLVHLHICCPARGRFYLYKSIRVVFANRVPDGMEKLSNDTTWPEPRFSPYKPIRLMHPVASLSAGPAAALASDKALRRRSLGVSFGCPSAPASSSSPSSSSSSAAAAAAAAAGGGAGVGAGSDIPPLDPVAFRLPPPFRHGSDTDVMIGHPHSFTSPVSSPSRPSSSDTAMTNQDDSSSATPNVASPIPPPPPWGSEQYEKLTRDEAGCYWSDSPPSSGPAEGLLSLRLRPLGLNKYRR